MKVSRQDMCNRILAAAKDEFLLHGYAQASMRAIASQAGMTVGNIYLYYASKEDLFEAVVQQPVSQVQKIMQMPKATDETVRQLAYDLQEAFNQNRVEFLILITKADGSKFASYKQMLVNYARRRFGEMLPRDDAVRLSSPLAVSIIEGILDIFIHFDGDERQLAADLFRYLQYMLQGLMTGQPTEAMP